MKFSPDFDAQVIRMGERVVPCAEMFKSDYMGWSVRRARIHTDSGFVFSLVWGSGTYCDNYNASYGFQEIEEEPETVELMTMVGSIGDGRDEPRAHQTVADVLALIDAANEATP